MCDFVQCTLPYIPSLKRERTHAAHGTILINFGSEKRTYIFEFPGAYLGGGLHPRSPTRRWPGPAVALGGPQTPRQEVRLPSNVYSWIRAWTPLCIFDIAHQCLLFCPFSFTVVFTIVCLFVLRFTAFDYPIWYLRICHMISFSFRIQKCQLRRKRYV
jgi:hypothetical protein